VVVSVRRGDLVQQPILEVPAVAEASQGVGGRLLLEGSIQEGVGNRDRRVVGDGAQHQDVVSGVAFRSPALPQDDDADDLVAVDRGDRLGGEFASHLSMASASLAVREQSRGT